MYKYECIDVYMYICSPQSLYSHVSIYLYLHTFVYLYTRICCVCSLSHVYIRQSRTLSENINMTNALLSRFDLVFTLKDEPNRKTDSYLSRHLLTVCTCRYKYIYIYYMYELCEHIYMCMCTYVIVRRCATLERLCHHK